MKATSNTIKRSIELSEYIPLQIISEDICPSAEYYIFQKDGHSLLELVFREDDHLVHRITLVICAEFQKIEEQYQTPLDSQTGDLYIDSADEIDTNTFTCRIFKDAIKITVSSLPTSSVIHSENVVWELSSTGDLVSCCVINLSPDVVEHCYQELLTVG